MTEIDDMDNLLHRKLNLQFLVGKAALMQSFLLAFLKEKHEKFRNL